MRRGLVLPFALVLSLALAAGLTELYDGLEAALGQVRLENPAQAVNALNRAQSLLREEGALPPVLRDAALTNLQEARQFVAQKSAVDLEARPGEAPDLGEACPGVERKLLLPVPGLGGEAHLHQEEHVLRAGMGLGVEVLLHPEPVPHHGGHYSPLSPRPFRCYHLKDGTGERGGGGPRGERGRLDPLAPGRSRAPF